MNLSDDELDKLFKDASDKFEGTGAKPDWDGMRSLLDQHLPEKDKSKKRGFFWLFFVSLFLISGGTLIYFNQDITGKKQEINRQELPKGQRVTATRSENIKPGNSTNPNPVQHSNVPGGINRASSRHSEVSLVKNERNNTEKAHIQEPAHKTHGGLEGVKPTKPGSIPANRRNETAISKNETELALTTSSVSEHIAEDSRSNITNSPKRNQEGNLSPFENPASQEVTAIQELNEHDLQPGNETEKDSIVPVTLAQPTSGDSMNTLPGSDNTSIPGEPDIANTSQAKSKNRRGIPLVIRLLYAPELTTVGFSKITRPGSNYGLLAGYSISNKTILQTGFITSRKNYLINGSDFVPAYAIPSNHKLTKVVGYCTMYEIPLSIQSQIQKGNTITISYSAGLSSYFMKRQYYTYYYQTNYGSYSKSQEYDSQLNYWFSVISLGLDFEKEITQSIQISASPFVKIPLKQMGEGNLKLTGVGVNFLLSYKPFLNRK